MTTPPLRVLNGTMVSSLASGSENCSWALICMASDKKSKIIYPFRFPIILPAFFMFNLANKSSIFLTLNRIAAAIKTLLPLLTYGRQ